MLLQVLEQEMVQDYNTIVTELEQVLMHSGSRWGKEHKRECHINEKLVTNQNRKNFKN